MLYNGAEAGKHTELRSNGIDLFIFDGEITQISLGKSPCEGPVMFDPTFLVRHRALFAGIIDTCTSKLPMFTNR